jgi:hypothetical protein
LWLAVLGVAVLAAAAGLVGREIYKRPPEQVGSPPPIAVAGPSSTTTPPGEQPGSQVVMATQDAASYPQYQAILQMLQDHFDAINGKRYPQWRGTVTKVKGDQMPEAVWRRDYRTTVDGSILLYRIEAAPDKKLRILLGFTSVQDIADAPADLRKPCIVWRVTLPLAKEDNKWRIDAGLEGSSPQHQECGTQAS